MHKIEGLIVINFIDYDCEFDGKPRQSCVRVCEYPDFDNPERRDKHPNIVGSKNDVKGAFIINPDEIVIKEDAITLCISYPLRGSHVEFYHENKGGFTRMDLFRCAYESYCEIYKDPEGYQVWGHGMEDLYLEAIIPDEKFPGVYHLSMGS